MIGSPAPLIKKAPPRLDGVDGLRGVAAMAIVTHHMYDACNLPEVRVAGLNILRPLDDFPAAVDLFLVLSGFCLFWPYARDAGRKFDYLDFMRRRCWRIIPAYYVSLLVVPILYSIFWAHLGMLGRTNWPRSWLDFALHVTLLHTAYYKTFHGWTGASWNLGLEWQWYLAFPLGVWLMRRAGPLGTIIFLGILSVVYHGLVLMIAGPSSHMPMELFLTYRELIPGRMIEFGLGMAAAWWLANRGVGPWMMRGMLAAIVLGLLAARVQRIYQGPLDPMYASRAILYSAVFSLVMLAAVAPIANPIRALCSLKPLRLAGQASYSIYLFHLPFVLLICKEMVRHTHSNGRAFFLSLFFIPVIVLIARLGYATLEKPFMVSDKSASKRRTPEPAAQPAAAAEGAGA